MSGPSKRIFKAARQAPAYFTSIRSAQQYNAKASTPWICTQCTHRRLLSTGSKIDRSHLKKPIGIQLRYQQNQKRLFSSSTPHLDDPTPRSDLPSAEEGRRSHASKRFDHLMDNIQSNIFIAGQRLNDLTGYSGIEALRKEIEQQERFVATTRHALTTARAAYTTAITLRATSQREVNELLQRKHAWTPPDLERFTQLYRSDHTNEQTASTAQQTLSEVEKQAEEAAQGLQERILRRYHEEQIWSDKIRRMSTWGTWGLMGVNVVLFLVFQVAVEPWRRGMLVRGFEEKVREALEGGGREGDKGVEEVVAGDRVVDAGIGLDMAAGTRRGATEAEAFDVSVKQGEGEEMDELVPVAVLSTDTEDVLVSTRNTFDAIVQRILDLFSDRQVAMRQKDLTTVAIESAAAGIAFSGLLLLLIRPR